MARTMDEIAPNFRKACDRWPDAALLAGHYEAVSTAIEGNGHGALATIKSFVESVCITVLADFGIQPPSDCPKTEELFIAALKPLGLQNTRGASKLDKLLSAHNRLCDALNDMRNDNDPTAHGKDGFLDRMTGIETQSFLHTGDALLGLIFAAYEGTTPDLRYTREPYDRFLHLNERIDQSIAASATVETGEDSRQVIVVTLERAGSDEQIELRFEPSKLLYAVDRTAYLEVLATSKKTSIPEDEDIELQEFEAVVPEPIADIVTQPVKTHLSPIPPITAGEYTGRLLPLFGGLRELLGKLKLTSIATARLDGEIPSAILFVVDPSVGLDWENREALKANMRVSLRRALVALGVSRDEAREAAALIEEWLAQQHISPTQ